MPIGQLTSQLAQLTGKTCPVVVDDACVQPIECLRLLFQQTALDRSAFRQYAEISFGHVLQRRHAVVERLLRVASDGGTKRLCLVRLPVSDRNQGLQQVDGRALRHLVRAFREQRDARQQLVRHRQGHSDQARRERGLQTRQQRLHARVDLSRGRVEAVETDDDASESAEDADRRQQGGRLRGEPTAQPERPEQQRRGEERDHADDREVGELLRADSG